MFGFKQRKLEERVLKALPLLFMNAQFGINSENLQNLIDSLKDWKPSTELDYFKISGNLIELAGRDYWLSAFETKSGHKKNLGILSFYPNKFKQEHLSFEYNNLNYGFALHPGIGFLFLKQDSDDIIGDLPVSRYGHLYLRQDFQTIFKVTCD